MCAGAGAGAGELSSILISSSYSQFVMKQFYPPENITGSFHPHALQLKDATDKPYTCGGCKEKGLGKVYQCKDGENCDYHLHQRCYDLSKSGYSSIKFTFLQSKKCDFVFQKEAPGANQRACDACGRDVKGWSYQCKMCKKPHYLHPCCANLPVNRKGEKVVLDLKAKTSSKCLKCESKNISQGLRGWFYASNCGNYCYHVGCVMDMVVENLENGGHGCDDGRYLIKETSAERKGRSCESLTRPQSRAITKRSPKVVTMKILKEATKIVLNLIISAILGIPITSACAAFYNLF
ncbi:hypothetical protein PVL29_016645 [Vitis rotundifolia]|uniref:DC1 domain-containing protein n=1 Tax=Vitis rotundifolia TaxID=103349 RepID=A0AA38Z8A7_VITRO|nr:hypothetical protein PVL29_016645 [Vitis rotundifolia]